MSQSEVHIGGVISGNGQRPSQWKDIGECTGEGELLDLDGKREEELPRCRQIASMKSANGMGPVAPGSTLWRKKRPGFTLPRLRILSV